MSATFIAIINKMATNGTTNIAARPTIMADGIITRLNLNIRFRRALFSGMWYLRCFSKKPSSSPRCSVVYMSGLRIIGSPLKYKTPPLSPSVAASCSERVRILTPSRISTCLPSINSETSCPIPWSTSTSHIQIYPGLSSTKTTT